MRVPGPREAHRLGAADLDLLQTILMAQGERAEDGRIYWGRRPDELAAICVMDAEEHGFALELRPETPVVPDERFTWLVECTTWADIEGLVRRLGDVGCAWVNLRFALADDGTAVVRYEAMPCGEPLPDGGIPACNGGFDCHRLMSHEEFERLHPLPVEQV
jgi:hypothetical protein